MNKNPLGHEKIPVLLRQFAIPSIIAMVVSSLYNIVDQIFIGQGVGYLGNAATNVAFPITTICLAAALLVGVGGAAKFSLELGAGNIKEAQQCIGNMFWMAVAFGLVICAVTELFIDPLLNAFGATETVLPYAHSYVRIIGIGVPFLLLTNVLSNSIRADGSPKYSMACMVIGAVVNTVLDPIFIFGFHMGVAGAAWATMISQVISFLVAFRYLFRFKTVKLGKDFFHLSPIKCVEIVSLGISNSLNQLALTLLQIVLNNSLTYYGGLSVYGSDIPLSGAGIVMKVNSIVIGVFVGLAQGSQPILGFNYGAKQYNRVKALYKLEIQCSFVMSILAFLTFQLFPQTIISLFGSGEGLYMEFTVRFMRIFLMMIIINNVQMLSASFFSAIGKPMKGVLLSLSRQVLLLIPLILIFPLFWGLNGIMYSAPVADVLAFFLSIAVVRKEFADMDKLEKQSL
jgi:putative MATE family efflux protein